MKSLFKRAIKPTVRVDAAQPVGRDRCCKIVQCCKALRCCK